MHASVKSDLVMARCDWINGIDGTKRKIHLSQSFSRHFSPLRKHASFYKLFMTHSSQRRNKMLYSAIFDVHFVHRTNTKRETRPRYRDFTSWNKKFHLCTVLPQIVYHFLREMGEIWRNRGARFRCWKRRWKTPFDVIERNWQYRGWLSSERKENRTEEVRIGNVLVESSGNRLTEVSQIVGRAVINDFTVPFSPARPKSIRPFFLTFSIYLPETFHGSFEKFTIENYFTTIGHYLTLLKIAILIVLYTVLVIECKKHSS